MARPIYKGGQPFSKPGLQSTYTSTDSSSKYLVDAQMTLAADAGSNTVSLKGAVRGMILGAGLTKTATLQAGVHGVYWVTGSNATTWPRAGVLGETHAGVGSPGNPGSDGCVVAMTGQQGYPRAMFAVAAIDPDVATAQYGLDLGNNSFPSGLAMGYEKADINFSKGAAFIIGGSSAPTNGAGGTGAGWAGPGSLFSMTGGTIKLYQNTGTLASPTWTPQT